MILCREEKKLLLAYALLPVSISITVVFIHILEILMDYMDIQKTSQNSFYPLSIALFTSTACWIFIWKKDVSWTQKVRVHTWGYAIVLCLVNPLLYLAFVELCFRFFGFSPDGEPVIAGIASACFSLWMVCTFLFWPANTELDTGFEFSPPVCPACGHDMSDRIDTLCPACEHQATVDELWETCVIRKTE